MDIKSINNLTAHTLAFVGDSIFELKTRTYIIEKYGNMPTSSLHNKSVSFVNAKNQAFLYTLIENMLTQVEFDIFKKGRNLTNIKHPKSATSVDYHIATGLEALFGWLYLTKNLNRIDEIFEIIKEYI